MNKPAVAASVAALLVAGAVGGGMVADQKIKELYDPNGPVAQANKTVAIRDSQVDMGLTGGKAQWTASYTPDLCQTEQKLTFRGEDEIKRGLSGYRIISKIYFVPEAGSEVFIGNSEMALGFGGDAQVKLTVPAGSHKEESQNISITWGEASWQLDLSRQDKQGQSRYAVDRYQIQVPEIRLHEDSDTIISLKNMVAKGDMPLQAGLLKAGDDEFSLESLETQALSPTGAISLNQISSKSSVVLNGDSVDSDTKFEVGGLSWGGKTYQNIRINAAFKGLNKAALQQFADLMERQQQSCLAPAQMEQSLKQIGVALLQKGLGFESAGNQVELNGSKATLAADVKLPAGQGDDAEALTRQAMETMQYTLTLAADRQFVAQTGLLEQNGRTISDEELQQMAAQLPPPLKLTLDDKQITLRAAKP